MIVNFGTINNFDGDYATGNVNVSWKQFYYAKSLSAFVNNLPQNINIFITRHVFRPYLRIYEIISFDDNLKILLLGNSRYKNF